MAKNSIFSPGGDVLYNAYLPCDMLINSYAAEDIRGHEKPFFFREYTDANGNTYELNNVGNWARFDEGSLTTSLLKVKLRLHVRQEPHLYSGRSERRYAQQGI